MLFIDPKVIAMPLFRSVLLVGSLLALAACTAPAPNQPSSARAKATPLADARSPKSFEDGSKPFTMPEIQDRLLRVLALPPEQINKEAVEKIFGMVLKGERNTFYEDISDDRKVGFVIEAPPAAPLENRLEYSTLVKKTEIDGKEKLSEKPLDIPVTYKFSYPLFVQKIESSGWEYAAIHRSHMLFFYDFQKEWISAISLC